MIWLSTLLAVAPCTHPQLDTVPEERQRAACALLAQRPPPPSSLSRETLLALYAQPQFERARDRDSGALAEALRRALDWLKVLFETRAAERYSEWGRVAVLTLGALASLGFLARAAGRRRARLKGSPSSRGASRSPALADRLHEAQALLPETPREAMRAGLLSLLSSLEAAGLARADRAQTNREVAQQLAHRGATLELSQSLGRLLVAFDRAFYSLAPISVEEARRFVEEIAQLTARPLKGEESP